MTKEQRIISEMTQTVIQEIESSEIIDTSKKSTVVTQLKKELRKFSSQTQFNIRMLLFTNRYDTIDKDAFLSWYHSTHITKLTDLKGGRCN